MNAEKTGKLISECRKEKQLTQLQLADLLHVSDKAVSRWETGKGFPDIGSLQSLGEVLDISVTELLKGERSSLEKDELENERTTLDLLELFKQTIRQKKIQSLLIGFLCSVIFLTLLLVHLNAPIYIEDAEKALKIETFSEGRIAAILDKEVSGYEISDHKDPDTRETIVTISCYRTLLHSFLPEKGQMVVMLGEKENPDYVFYYPYADGDQLLYAKNGSVSFGMETLPRLIYNGWIILGIVSTLIGLIAYSLLRKRFCGKTILKLTLFALSFTISILLVLWGKMDQVYNAAYYLSGIVLLSIFIELLFLSVFFSKER